MGERNFTAANLMRNFISIEFIRTEIRNALAASSTCEFVLRACLLSFSSDAVRRSDDVLSWQGVCARMYGGG